MASSNFDNPDHLTDDVFPTLELIKTRLRVVGDELQRTNGKGRFVMRLPLDTIQDLEIRTGFDPVGLVIAMVGVGLAALAYFVCENNLLLTLLYVAALVLMGFGLMGTWTRTLTIRSRGGVTNIVPTDMIEEAEGFVTSVRQMLQDRAARQSGEHGSQFSSPPL